MILLLETDQFWHENTLVLRETYAYEVPVPLENTYGMLLYSKLELSETKVRYLVDDEIPSIKTLVTLPSGQKVQLLHRLYPEKTCIPPSATRSSCSLQRR